MGRILLALSLAPRCWWIAPTMTKNHLLRMLAVVALTTALQGNASVAALAPEGHIVGRNPDPVSCVDGLVALRVAQTEPDAFDYLFTGAIPAPQGGWTLSVNHRSGRTFFVTVGDAVDEWHVTAFEPELQREFSPTLNAWQNRRSGRLTLTDPHGRSVILGMEKPLEQPGLRATLVSTRSGEAWSVRSGDSFHADGVLLEVMALDANEVWVRHDGVDSALSPILPEELASLSERKRALANRREADAEASFPADDPQEVSRGLPGLANRTRSRAGGEGGRRADFFAGTEYRYPSEYQVWMLPHGPDGKLRPVLIPRRFETGSVGMPYDVQGCGYMQEPYRPYPSSFLRIPHPDAMRRRSGTRR